MRFFEKRRWIAVILTIIIAGVIFYLSSLSFSVSPGVSWMSYAYHIIIFALLAFFLFVSFKGTGKIKVWQVLLVIFFVFVYAASDEFHQSFVPGRHAGLLDWLVDTSGILFSVFIYSSCSLIDKKYRKAKEKAYCEDIKNGIKE